MLTRGNASETGAPSRIGGWCSGIMEACWLAAALVVPVLYNPHAWRGFQFNKEAFFRILVLVTLAAFAIGALEKAASIGGDLYLKLWRKYIPLGASLLVLGSAYVIATCFSVYPSASLWGSDQHQQGALDFFCELVFLAAIILNLRTTEQVERLVTFIVVASIPVAIYAVMQRASLDPFQEVMKQNRTPSLTGNPIYLGAYLTMVMPLGLWRIFLLASSLRSEPLKSQLRTAALFFYVAVLVLQLAAFYCAESRGPLLALFVTLGFVFLGWSVYLNKPRWLIAGLALAGIVALGLVFSNLGKSPVKAALSDAGLPRFTSVLPVGEDTEDYRKAMWSQAAKLLFSSAPLPYPDGSTDKLHAIRPLVGYGPETLTSVLPHQYWWPSLPPKLEDRFHNLFWDTWFTTGFFGLAALLFFILLLFYQAYDRLGLLSPIGPRYLYWAIVPLFGVAGSIGFGSWLGFGFIGLGLIVGLVFGWGAYWPLAYLAPKAIPSSCTLPLQQVCLMIALLAAVAGHFIEMSFAYATPATSVLFWIYVGVIARLWHPGELVDMEKAATVVPADRSARKTSKGTYSKSSGQVQERPWLWAGLSSALLLITILFGFIASFSGADLSTTDVLSATLTLAQDGHSPTYLIWLLLVPTWIASSFAFAVEPFLKGKARNFDASLGLTLLIAGIIAIGYACLKAAQIAAIGPNPVESASTSSVLAQAWGYQILYLTFIALALGFVWAGGLFLSSTPSSAGRFDWRSLALVAIAQGLALVIAWFACINPVRASMLTKWAFELEQSGLLQPGVDVFREAVAIAPGDVEYHRMLSDGYMALTTKAFSPDGMNSSLTESEHQLQEAKRLTSGLDPSDYELGTLYLEWASIEPQAAKQIELAQQARAAFVQALVFQPAYEAIWTDRAAVDLIYLHDADDAKMSQEKASGLAQGSNLKEGDFYRNRLNSISNPSLKQFYAARARAFYEQGIRDGASDPLSAATCELAESKLDLALNDPDKALNECLDALKKSPAIDTWDFEMNLAQTYALVGKKSEALQSLEKALAIAPPDQTVSIQNLVNAMKAQNP